MSETGVIEAGSLNQNSTQRQTRHQQSRREGNRISCVGAGVDCRSDGGQLDQQQSLSFVDNELGLSVTEFKSDDDDKLENDNCRDGDDDESDDGVGRAGTM